MMAVQQQQWCITKVHGSLTLMNRVLIRHRVDCRVNIPTVIIIRQPQDSSSM